MNFEFLFFSLFVFLIKFFWNEEEEEEEEEEDDDDDEDFLGFWPRTDDYNPSV